MRHLELHRRRRCAVRYPLQAVGVQANDAAGTIEQGSRLEEQTARIVIRRAAFETAELRILVPVDVS